MKGSGPTTNRAGRKSEGVRNWSLSLFQKIRNEMIWLEPFTSTFTLDYKPAEITTTYTKSIYIHPNIEFHIILIKKNIPTEIKTSANGKQLYKNPNIEFRII